MSARARRSALYMPASNLKAIDKARSLDCDVVILDLEDAVAPEAKEAARAQAAAAIAAGGFGAREVVVRINGLDSDWGKPDIAAFANAPPDAVLLPKVNCGNDIRAVHPLLPSNVAIWAMIETTRAMLRLEDIASAGAGLRCFVMGTNDLAKELRAPLTQARANLHGLLTLSVTAARAFGLAILDGVFNDIDDELGFAAQCAQAVEFGFDGKTLIHPRQIGPCNLAFSPDHSAIAWAQRIVAAFELPGNACRGAIRVDGKMVELLHLEAARDTLARAAVSGT